MKTVLFFVCLFVSPCFLLTAATYQSLPNNLDPKAHYLFYLHGRIIEEQGLRPKHPKYGYYEYQQILQTLAGRGFVVISEPRSKGTDAVDYSKKVVNQIRSLLAAHVPPSSICVIGASKGSLIAMLVSTGLKNSQVRFVLMASCNDATEEAFHPNLTGVILSIYEESDPVGRSCKTMFAHSTGVSKSDEKELHLGIAHGFLYRPFKEWVEPAVSWCSGR